MRGAGSASLVLRAARHCCVSRGRGLGKLSLGHHSALEKGFGLGLLPGDAAAALANRSCPIPPHIQSAPVRLLRFHSSMGTPSKRSAPSRLTA